MNHAVALWQVSRKYKSEFALEVGYLRHGETIMAFLVRELPEHASRSNRQIGTRHWCDDHVTVDIDFERFKTKLQAREQELLNDRASSEQAVLNAPSAEVEDALDRANSGEAREDAERSLDREFKELGEVQDALARREAGTFGICEICGNPIEPARFSSSSEA